MGLYGSSLGFHKYSPALFFTYVGKISFPANSNRTGAVDRLV